MSAFLPDDFIPPPELEGDGFRLYPLGPEHNEADYAAWTSSVDHILDTPGYEGSHWPHPMTPDDNLADLTRHAMEFKARTGMTYTVLGGEPKDRHRLRLHLPERDARSRRQSPIVGPRRGCRAGPRPIPDGQGLARDGLAVRAHRLRAETEPED